MDFRYMTLQYLHLTLVELLLITWDAAWIGIRTHLQSVGISEEGVTLAPAGMQGSYVVSWNTEMEIIADE